MIKLENVNKFYKDLQVLRDINIEFNKGEINVIIGPSGCGKTTLLYCINRIEKVDSGKVFVNEQDICDKSVDISRLRTKLGMVFQHFSLFSHKNVLENIIMAPITVKKVKKEEAERKAIELLEKVGLKDKIYSYPAQLSGGQQQRIAIIRALAMDPETLLLDEPTNSLDVKMMKEMLNIIRDLSDKDGMTIILTTHELNFAGEVGHRMVFMHEGAIVEDSTPNELLFHPKNELTKNFLNQRLDGNFFE